MRLNWPSRARKAALFAGKCLQPVRTLVLSRSFDLIFFFVYLHLRLRLLGPPSKAPNATSNIFLVPE